MKGPLPEKPSPHPYIGLRFFVPFQLIYRINIVYYTISYVNKFFIGKKLCIKFKCISYGIFKNGKLWEVKIDFRKKLYA
jgi:hypothetical protein